MTASWWRHGGLLTWSDGSRIYDVYESNTPGIGYAISVADPNNQSNITPLRGTGDVRLFYFPEPPPWVGATVSITLIATGPLQTGKTPISNDPIVNFTARRPLGGNRAGTPQLIVNATINVQARTCSLISNAEQSITLDTFPVRAVEELPIGSALEESLSPPVTVAADCDPDVSLYATVNDSNDTGSLENYLANSASGAGSATGVGVQLLRDGNSVVSMGPASAETGNTNSFAVGTKTAVNEIPKEVLLWRLAISKPQRRFKLELLIQLQQSHFRTDKAFWMCIVRYLIIAM